MHRIAALLLFSVVASTARAGDVDCSGGCRGDFNADGRVTIDEVVSTVSQALNGCPIATVVLQPLQSDGASILLQWEPVEQSGFSAYRIYRAAARDGSGYQVIGVLSDPTAAMFRDTNVSFGTTYLYYVAVVTGGGVESQSNSQQGTAGVFVDINGQVEVLRTDPKRPYVYALDRVNNSLYFISTQTRQIEKTIFVGSMPTDMDIDAAGDELFIANFGSTEIAVVDLTTQEKTRSLFVDTAGTWDGNPYRLACGPQGTLVFTSYDQWNDLTLIDTATGATLNNQASVYAPDLVASPDKTRIYVGESGISSSAPMRYDVIGQTLTRTDIGNDAGGYSQRNIVTSGDGRYVYYARQKFLANNLKAVLGSFSEEIYAANADGSLVFGYEHIFNGTTFGILRASPVTTGTLALSSDEQTLYLYDITTSRIYFFPLSSL